MQLPLKYHGGKNYLAARIRSLFPPHKHYVEPFFGGGAVLLSGDGVGVSEVANDIDRRLTNFWRVLQLEDLRWDLVDLLEHTPFSEEEWLRASEELGRADCRICNVGLCPCVRCAWMFFTLCRQSMAGRMTSFTPRTKTRVRRSMSEQASSWWTAVNTLEQVGDRLSRVVILNRPALDVVRQEDGKDTLFYLDPPYLMETRAGGGYKHEMTYEQHEQMLDLICSQVKGKVVLSGYPSQLYSLRLHDWYRLEIKVPNHAASGDEKRAMTECLWMNYRPEDYTYGPDS